MGIESLIKIMEALRLRCPWDKGQTRQSLKPFIVEESYEVLEAIDENDPEKIKEELGDLLFQIIFQCRIASERGEFNLEDVIKGISEKMTRRHPHVFAGADCKTSEEVSAQWEEIKKAEAKTKSTESTGESILEGVPKALPSLLRAHRLQAKAAKAGFDWEKIEDVIKKLDEEILEFKAALKGKSQSEVEDELGDIFFMLVNISRYLGVNPEDALRRTISKFISRFRYIEIKAAEKGVGLKDMTLEEMDRLWDEAKGAASPGD